MDLCRSKEGRKKESLLLSATLVVKKDMKGIFSLSRICWRGLTGFLRQEREREGMDDKDKLVVRTIYILAELYGYY